MRKYLVISFTAFLAKISERYYNIFRSEESEECFRGVTVVGNDIFKMAVKECLTRLEEGDPYGFRLVQRYLCGVVATDRDIAFGVSIGVYFETTKPDGHLEWPRIRLAACLVRNAIYARLLRNERICVWRNARVQVLALRRELRSMQLLGCAREYLDQQEEFIRRKYVVIRKRRTG